MLADIQAWLIVVRKRQYDVYRMLCERCNTTFRAFIALIRNQFTFRINNRRRRGHARAARVSATACAAAAIPDGYFSMHVLPFEVCYQPFRGKVFVVTATRAVESDFL